MRAREKQFLISSVVLPLRLPLSEEADSGGQFDGVVCSAVLMLVPEADRFNAAFSLKRVLREKGRLLISVPGSRPVLNAEDGDEGGRLFKPLHPENLLLLFERRCRTIQPAFPITFT